VDPKKTKEKPGMRSKVFAAAAGQIASCSLCTVLCWSIHADYGAIWWLSFFSVNIKWLFLTFVENGTKFILFTLQRSWFSPIKNGF